MYWVCDAVSFAYCDLGCFVIAKDGDRIDPTMKSFVIQSIVVTSLKRTIKRIKPNGGKFGFLSGYVA